MDNIKEWDKERRIKGKKVNTNKEVKKKNRNKCYEWEKMKKERILTERFLIIRVA